MAYLAAPVEALRTDRRFNPLTPDERDRFSQHLFSLSHTVGLGLFGSLATTVYHFRAGGDYDVRIDPDLWNFNLASQWSGLLTTAHAERGALALDVGAHATTYRRDHWLHIRPDLETRSYTNTGRKDEASGFAKLSADLAPILLVADLQLRGARFRYAPDANSGVTTPSIDWGFVNPKVGATVRLFRQLSLYGSVGRTGREPTRNDMFAGFDNLDATNIDFVGSFERVRPEYVTDVEAGATVEAPYISFRANGFWMAFRDEITPVGQLSYIGLPLRKNVNESTRRGVELDATLRGIPRLEGTFGGALMHSRIREYTDDASGLTYRNVEPLLTPRLTAVHDLRYTVAGPLSLSLSGHYASRSYLANTGDDRFVLPAAYVADAGLRVGGEQRSIQLIVYNVGDSHRYSGGYTDGITSWYYPYAARHFTLTARTTF
jgi:iron complex outermembrane receptor protein